MSNFFIVYYELSKCLIRYKYLASNKELPPNSPDIAVLFQYLENHIVSIKYISSFFFCIFFICNIILIF